MKTISLILLLAVIFLGCQKEESFTNGPANNLPELTTTTVVSVTNATAISGGNITADGGTVITARGVCWSASTHPVISDSHTTNGIGTGFFTSLLTGLTTSTIYYIRAYATNGNGTSYGNELAFATRAVANLPSITTQMISLITSTTASGGGNVLNDGGSPITSRGICWGTSPGPVVSGNHTTDGTGLGAFTSSMTSLVPSITYYVRAYAINVNGTSYGNENSFSTMAPTSLTMYAAGYENNGTHRVAKFWKNGMPFSLTDGTRDAEASSIFVVGSDVYVTGWENRATNIDVAVLWKNGVTVDQSSGTFFARGNAIFVNATDIFVSGYESTPPNNIGHAKYWKNGTSVSLPDGSINGSVATGIAVSGTDVYASGDIAAPPTIYNKAVIWKNGIETDLPLNPMNHGFANAIIVVGSDIYVAGYSHDFVYYTPKYWKNGVVYNMPPGPANVEARAESIDVNGTDVYLSGWQLSSATAGHQIAKYWKNGVATDLTNGTYDAVGSSIKIFGGDIYVAGSESNIIGNGIAKYWKNGVATNLTDGSHDAYIASIVIQ